MVFSSILQNGGSKPKIFWEKRGTKHPLSSENVKLFKLFICSSSQISQINQYFLLFEKSNFFNINICISK
jgi:hypothetical protein